MHGKDVNKRQVLIVFMPVADNENLKMWNIFFKFIYEIIGDSWGDKIIIMDQYKAGKMH